MNKNNLPIDYVENYIYQYVGYVKKGEDGVLYGGCPICKEDTSWGKKARFYYNPSYEGEGLTVICFNCGYNKTSAQFISDVSGLTWKEIQQECSEYDVIPMDYSRMIHNLLPDVSKDIPSLPKNCVNLSDPIQVDYYKDNEIVNLALKYLKDRKIDQACNQPKTFYVSLEDYVHKNRLIIPYFVDGKIAWYQSRRLLDDDSAKYLSKGGGDRVMFNIDQINPDIPYIFITEGAIDCMFIENGTCVSGITENGKFILTKEQEKQLAKYPLHERVWILDCPYNDEAAENKTKMLVEMGEKVFDWPMEWYGKYKDLNDIIINSKHKKIPQKLILGNLVEKDELKMRFKKIRMELS